MQTEQYYVIQYHRKRGLNAAAAITITFNEMNETYRYDGKKRDIFKEEDLRTIFKWHKWFKERRVHGR
jgi:hypothetical protein